MKLIEAKTCLKHHVLEIINSCQFCSKNECPIYYKTSSDINIVLNHCSMIGGWTNIFKSNDLELYYIDFKMKSLYDFFYSFECLDINQF